MMAIRTELCSSIQISPEWKKELFWYDIRNFPDSLLIEILARLPVKTMFRFKSVCKHWQTLISHPSFSRFCISILNSNSNAAALPFRILYMFPYLPNCKEFFNRLAPEIHSWLKFSVVFLSSPEDRQRYDTFRILDMSNGLLLCSTWSPKLDYYICDPLTRKWITIPRRGPQPHNCSGEGLITRVNEDHMLTGYTLVRAQVLHSPSNYFNLEMFSSETGEWIDHKLPCTIPIKLQHFRFAIHCYGALHWLVVRSYSIQCIVAFDLYKDPKSVRLIPLPNDRDFQCEKEHRWSCILFDECQGTLRYFQVACNPSKLYLFTMWAIKDYEKGEWCCEFKVRRSDVHSSDQKLSNWLVDGWFSPLLLHPLNPNVVYLKCMEPECIVSYDALNRRLDVASEPIDSYRKFSWRSVIPFVLPRWPVLV